MNTTTLQGQATAHPGSSRAAGERSRLMTILWSFRREFAMAGLFSLVANLLMLSPTLYMLQVFDRVYVSQNHLTLYAMTLLMVLFALVMALAEWLRSRLLVRAGVQFDKALGERVYRAGFRAELEQSGHKAAQALADLTQIRQFLTGTGTIAFFDAPWTPVYIAVCYLLHPLLGLLALVFVINLLALAWFNQRRTAKPQQAAAEAELEANRYLSSKMRNAEVVESMGMLDDLRRRWQQRHRRLLDAQEHVHGRNHGVTSMVKFVRYSQQSLALGAGALLAIEGEISVGAMIAANVLVSRASSPIEVLVGTWSQFMQSRDCLLRLEALLEEHPEGRAGTLRPALGGAVRLQGLSATAPGRERPIVQPLDTRFEAGQLVGIVGPSGSGKSTLARSLLGIWPYASGEVLYDDTPVSELDRSELGRQLGYLPQDVELFEGSIAENIARFGEIDADRVIEAAQRAGMHEMILRFPQGYDTPIGAGGSVLSGGQRQRIALARALYGDPRVLVLDEPNANLDDAGEAALVAALLDLKARGCTVFLVTHRPSALQVVDRLMVMRDGAVIADGPRDAVLASLRPAAAVAAAAPAPDPTPPADDAAGPA
jgi:ATP-binding cassette subfamily C exporter for protease/lipase